MDETFDVPDSTDWIGTPLASLMPVEQAFRCHVCKDFYNSPMITSCNHTFCSLCIRRSLAVEGRCPLCRATDQESKLRGNWALREAVDTFVQSRPAILQFAKSPYTIATAQSPKRKADESDSLSQDISDSKRPRMSTRLSKSKAVETTSAMMRAEVEVPRNREIEEEYEPDDGLVACPICLTRMKEAQVDRHLDTSCPGSPRPRKQQEQQQPFLAPQSSSARASTNTKPPERLPTLGYSMMKEQALRKKLAELGIPTGGSKQMLERRHREWVMIWNANCDSAQPKKRTNLLHDLDAWERTVGTRAPVTSRAANMGAQIKDKDFDGAAWATKHNGSFNDLIANARKSKRRAEEKVEEKGSDVPVTNHAKGRQEAARETGEAQEDANSLRDPDREPMTLQRNGSRPNTQPPQDSQVVDLTGPCSSQPETCKPDTHQGPRLRSPPPPPPPNTSTFPPPVPPAEEQLASWNDTAGGKI